MCLIDVRMPGSGIHAVAEITAQVPGAAVVMLTVSSETTDLVDAVNAGAAGHLLKDMDPSLLPDAVRSAMAGEAPIPGMLTARLLDELRRRGARTTLTVPDGRSVRLTGREWEVIELLADGLSTAQIAQRLYIDPVTVRRHISQLKRKAKLSSRDGIGRLLPWRTSSDPRRSPDSRRG